MAFSLVELSIVLVVLGLLVGGVLSGRSLIRASELRSVTTDVNRYQAAVFAFRDKYFWLPGDIPNATSIWGAADPTPATCLTTNSGGKATCNGNGDGYIGDISGGYERHRFWQHLANAGLIEGTFTGVPGPGGSYHSVLTNPSNAAHSKISNAGFSVASPSGDPTLNPIVSHHSFFDGDYGTRLFFGTQNDALASAPLSPALTTTEAWNIDTKTDDGKPAYGNVLNWKNGALRGPPNCVTTAVSSTAAYDLSTTAINCAMMFRIHS